MADWIEAFNLILERLDRLCEAFERIADAPENPPSKPHG